MSETDEQLGIWGDVTPTGDMPRMRCSNDAACKAEADEHEATCPVEQDLRETFGF